MKRQVDKAGSAGARGTKVHRVEIVKSIDLCVPGPCLSKKHDWKCADADVQKIHYGLTPILG